MPRPPRNSRGPDLHCGGSLATAPDRERTMRQATIGPRPHRTGLLRRILTGGGGSPAVRQHLHPDVLDLRPSLSYPDSFEDLAGRVERLEVGMELMATTMKRALTRLADRTVSTS